MAAPDLIEKLSSFCKASKREHYTTEHDELASYLSIEAQLFRADLAMTEAIGRLSHDLLQWSEAVAELREEWLFDHSEAELPEDYIAVFGCDNELSRERLRIIDAMRRLVSHLRAGPRPSRDSDEISRKDLLKFLDIKTSTLTTRINKNGFPKPCRTEGKKQWFSITEVEAWQARMQRRNKL